MRKSIARNPASSSFRAPGRKGSALPLAALLAAIALCGCNRATGRADSPEAAPPAPAAAPSGMFRNVALEAGLNFRWGHGGKSPLNILETLGHGCAFLDFDQDGLLDILLVGNRRCILYRNTGQGRFAEVGAESGLTAEGALTGVAAGDYDNDGYPDLYITGYGKCALYRNTGAARRGNNPFFEDVTEKAGVGARGPYDVVTAAAFADLDGDGRLDLFAGRYIVFTPESLQLCTYQGVQAGCGIKNYDADFPSVYRNLGGGKFADSTKAWGFDAAHGKCLGVAVGAAEAGGVMLYAANDEVPCDLFARRGGKYVNIGVPSSTAYKHDGLTQGGMGADWGDYDNDGLPDLIVATFYSEPKSLYRNDGDDLFTESSGPLGIAAGTTPYIAWTAKFFDCDNDGWLDLLFTNGHTQDNVQQVQADQTYPQPLLLYRSEQGKAFREANREGGPDFGRKIAGRGAAFGDYDNDGRLDVLIVDEEGAPLLLHNEGQSANRWLGVRLVGTRSNRDGIGARVTVRAGGRTVTQDQSLAGGYLSAHDPRVHFGLGTASEIEKVVVRWPNGKTDTLRDVPTNAYITITEGKGWNQDSQQEEKP